MTDRETPAQAAFRGQEGPAFLTSAQAAWSEGSHLLVSPRAQELVGASRRAQAHAYTLQVLAMLATAAVAILLGRRLLPQPSAPVYLVDTGERARSPDAPRD